MPGRDKAGLDGAAWEKLPGTEIAIRTDSATGTDTMSRSTKTYSEVTSPKSKAQEVILTTDPGALALLQHPGEGKEEYIARLASFSPKKEKMTDVGKTDAKKEDVGKANAIKAKDLFDMSLIHVLTILLGLQLDTRHARVGNILNANECYGWSDFKNKHVYEWLKEE